MRLFIALDLPSGIKQKIGKIINEIKNESSIRFIPPQNIHLTLAFFGGGVREKSS